MYMVFVPNTSRKSQSLRTVIILTRDTALLTIFINVEFDENFIGVLQDRSDSTDAADLYTPTLSWITKMD